MNFLSPNAESRLSEGVLGGGWVLLRRSMSENGYVVDATVAFMRARRKTHDVPKSVHPFRCSLLGESYSDF